MLFSGWAFFIAALSAIALSALIVLDSVACHSSSVGLEEYRMPSSLTLPISIGTFFEISGAPSKNDRTLIRRPSIVGDEPTLGPAPAAPGPAGPRCGPFTLAAAAFD